MKFHKKLVTIWVGVLFMAGLAQPTHTSGIPVLDAMNVSQATISAMENVAAVVKQIQQYQTQLQQYENMIRNTIAPAAYVWTQAEYTMNRLVQATNTLKYYKSQGGIDNYLNRYRNAGYYSNSPCFKFGIKCTTEDWRLMREGQAKSTDVQKIANDASLRGLEVHESRLPMDAAHLQVLQSRAQTAEGKMEAIQYANQLAAYHSNQLLQLRSMLVAQFNAQNAREQVRIDKEAIQQASHEASTRRLSPVNFPPAKKWNVRDIF